MTRKNQIRIISGILFLTIGILDIFYSALLIDTELVLWFCYISLVLLGIATLYKKGYLVGTQICILGIPSMVWNVDFLYRIITGAELFGFTNYMFSGGINLGRILSLQHLFVVPLALVVLYIIKSERMDFWKLGFLEITIIYILSLTLTKVSNNVNWVFREEFGLGIEFGRLYFLVWFIIFFLVVGITNYILFKVKIFRG